MRGLTLWLGWKVARYDWKRLFLSALGVTIAFSFIATVFFVGDSVHQTLVHARLEPLANMDMELLPNGTLYLDQRIESLLRDDKLLMTYVDGISPRFVVRGGVGINSDEELITTGVALMGMNLTKDAPMGAFYKNGGEIDLENVLRTGNEDLTRNVTRNLLAAAITDSLAAQLQLNENDTLTLQFTLNHGQIAVELKFYVVNILDTRGKISFYSTESVVTDLARLQDALGLKGNITQLAISWRVPNDGSLTSEDVQELIEGQVSKILAVNGYHDNVMIFRTREQQEALINRATSNLTSFFTAMGLGPIAAAITLIIIIFYLLVEERRRELGTLKSMGFTSREVAFHLLTEAAFLIVLSSVGGIVLGAGLSTFILSFLNQSPPEGSTFSFARGVRYGWKYELIILPKTVLLTILVGSLVALLPTIIAAMSMARINPISVLHEHEESIWEEIHRNTKKGIIASLVAAVFGAYSFSQLSISADNFIIGLLITLGTLYFVLVYLFPKQRILLLLLSMINMVIAYGIILQSTNPTFWGNTHPSIVVMSLVFVFAIVIACIFVTQMLPFLIGLTTMLTTKFKSSALSLLLALSSLRHQRTRTLLILGVFSLVVSMAFMVTTFSASRDVGIQNELTSGYTLNADFVAYLAKPLDNITEWQDRRLQYQLDEHLVQLSDWRLTDAKVSFKELSSIAEEDLEGQEYFTVVGMDSVARDRLNLTLLARKGSLGEAEAWETVLAGKAVFLPSWYYQYYQVPFTDITIEGITKNVTIPVVGFLHANNAEIYISKNLFDELFPTVSGSRILYFSLKDQSRENDLQYLTILQSNLTKALLPWGPLARSSKLYFAQIQPLVQSSFQTIENYIYLGIIIGIVGIALVTSRKIRQSRFEFGVLMSFGASRREIGAAVLLEVSFFVIISMIIGFLVPVMFFGEVLSVAVNAPLIIPLNRLGLWTLVIMMVTIGSALIPIMQLQQMEPAVILREIEG